MFEKIKNIFAKKVTPPPYLWNGNYGFELAPPTDRAVLLNSMKSWVYVFVDKNAKSVADVPLNVYVAKETTSKTSYKSDFVDKQSLKHLKKDSLGIANKIKKALAVEELYDHPLNALLDKPNLYMTGIELKYLTMLHLELTGDAYWYVVKNNLGVPVEIWPLYPDMIEIVPSEKNYIEGYLYKTGVKNINFSSDEVIHFCYMHPTKKYYGLSPLEANWPSFNINTDIEVFQKAIFKNMGRPDGILMFDHNLDDDAMNRVREGWKATYGGVSNAGKIGILEGGTKYQPISNKPTDLDYIEGKKALKEQLANAFGQTLGMYSESANRSNADTAMYSYTINTVVPKLNYIVEKLNSFLAPMFDEKVFVGYEDIVPEDKEYLLKKKAEYLKNGILTINEIREEEGLPPQIYGNYPMVNMASIPFAYDTTKPSILMDKIPMMDHYGNASKETAPKEEKPKEDKETKKNYSETESSEVWGDFVELTEEQEEILAEDLTKIINIYLKDLEKRAKKSDDYVEWIPKKDDYLDTLNLMFTKNYVKIFNSHYKRTLKELKKVISKQDEQVDEILASLAVDDKETLALLKEKIQENSVLILDALRKKVLLTIIDGVSAKKQTAEIIEMVRKEIPEFAKREIALMSRTGVLWVANHGSLLAMQNSKVVEKKQWFTAEDERVCEHCNAMHEKIVDVNEPFDLTEVEKLGLKVDYHNNNLQAPPLHPRCFDQFTEVFTEEGWKFFKDLNGKEKIYSLDPNTLEMEFVPYNKYIKYHYKGKMLWFRSNLIDQMVTPNHNMIYYENKKIKQIEAKDLTTDKLLLISKEKIVTGNIITKYEKDYDGFVYDVELTKNHILYTRRNQLYSWSGNCRCTILPILKGENNE
jgi:HK97 family phage portal protein